MTTKNAQPGQGQGYSALVGLASAVIGAAVISWLAGLGLSKGFGVHVPFVAGMLVILAVQFLTRSVSVIASTAYQQARIEAAPKVATAVILGRETAEQFLNSKAFVDIARKIHGE